ncbi:hypothetical protein V8J82_05905 [Gymnodinialimonas sp. 2305UL16-5]|uniref:hypothetical protein n=1 Tax=Gymnodinialimonas mytili TaxID=3126503 RepID=UPI00309D70DE
MTSSRLWLSLALLVAPVAHADPLRLLDVAELAETAGPYEPRIGQVQVGSLPDGTVVRITLSGDMSLCDPGPGPAFGTAVIDLLQAEFLARQCPEFETDDLAMRFDALRDLALPRYAELVDRPLRQVRRAYRASLEDMHIPVSCDDFAASSLRAWTSDDFEARLRAATVRDRLPAYACTWIDFEPP